MNSGNSKDDNETSIVIEEAEIVDCDCKYLFYLFNFLSCFCFYLKAIIIM